MDPLKWRFECLECFRLLLLVELSCWLQVSVLVAETREK